MGYEPLKGLHDLSQLIASRLNSKTMALHAAHEVVDKLEEDEQFKNDLKEALKYLATSPTKSVARKAARLLAYLEADFYTQEGDKSLGKPTENFPQVDGTNREEVRAFLWKIMPSLFDGSTPYTEDQIWDMWQGVWNNKGIHAGDVMFDLDETLYEYKINIFTGKESMGAFPVMIGLMALALRDKTPITYMSHTSSVRLRDFANHPRLAAFRFALFLRMPEDEDVSINDVRTMRGTHVYETLANRDVKLLTAMEKLVRSTETAARALTDDDVRQYAARRIAEPIQKFFRGNKGGTRTNDRVFVDDSEAKVLNYLASGGMAGVITGHRHYNPADLFEIMAQAKALVGTSGQPILVDLRNSSILPERGVVADAKLAHNQAPFWRSYVTPTTTLILTRMASLLRSRSFQRVLNTSNDDMLARNRQPRMFHVTRSSEGSLKLSETTSLRTTRFEGELGAYAGVALWDHVFVKNANHPTGKTSGLAHEILAENLGKNFKNYLERFNHYDVSPVLDEMEAVFREGQKADITRRLNEMVLSNVPLRERTARLQEEFRRLSDTYSEIYEQIDQARHGGENYLTDVIDGLLAVSLVGYKSGFSSAKGLDAGVFGKEGVLNLEDNYLPLWYALNRASDAVRFDVKGDKKLRSVFIAARKQLKERYKASTGTPPPGVYNWKKVKVFDRDQVDNAFSRELKVADQLKRSAIPEAFPSTGGRGVATTQGAGARFDADAIVARLDPYVATFNQNNHRLMVTVETDPDTGSVTYAAANYQPDKVKPDIKGRRSFAYAWNLRNAAKTLSKKLGQHPEDAFTQAASMAGIKALNNLQAQMTVRGLDKLDPNKVYIFAPTHMSVAEFPLLFTALNEFHTGFLAKDAFRDAFVQKHVIPVGGVMANSDRFLFWERSKGKKDPHAAVKLVLAAADGMTRADNRFSLIWYPQGTRALVRYDASGNRMDGDLYAKQGPLKDGVAYAALEMAARGVNVEIVPITINGLGRAMPTGNPAKLQWPVYGGLSQQNVEMVIGTPIDVSTLAPKALAVNRAARERELKANLADHEAIAQWRSENLTTEAQSILRDGAKAVTGAIDESFRAHYRTPVTPRQHVKRPKDRKKGERFMKLMDISVVQHMLTTATAPTRKLSEGNADRITLNHFLQPFAEAFLMLDEENESKKTFGEDHEKTLAIMGKISDWGEKKGVDGKYVRALYAVIPDGEKRAIYQRSAKVRKSLDQGMFVSGLVYGKKQQRANVRKALLPALRLAMKLIGHAGSYAADGAAQSKAGEKGLVKGVNAAARIVGPVARLLPSNRPNDVINPAIEELIPDEYRLDPIERQVAAQIIDNFIADRRITQLPDVLAARIDETYGVDSTLAEDFKAYAQDYLNAEIEDGRRFTEVAAKDISIDRTAMDTAHDAYIDRFQEVKWNGEAVDEFVFTSFIDLEESDEIIRPNPEAGEGVAASFVRLEDAEKALGALATDGAQEGQSKEDFEVRLEEARLGVVAAYDEYALKAGLAAGSETFQYLDQFIHALNEDVFIRIMNNVARDTDYDIGPIVENFKEFRRLVDEQSSISSKDKDGIKALAAKTGEVAQRLSSDLRVFLDTPGMARRYQHHSLRVQAGKDVLINNPLTIVRDFIGYQSDAFLTQSNTPKVQAYRKALKEYDDAMASYDAAKKTSSPRKIRKKEIASQQALKKVVEAVFYLVNSKEGTALAEKVEEYLNHHKEAFTGLAAARDAFRTSMKETRQWEALEKEKNEALMPAILDYARWREQTFGQFFARESEMNMRLAYARMDAVKASGKLTKKQRRELEDYERMFKTGRFMWQTTLSDKVNETPLQNFLSQLGVQDNFYQTLSGENGYNPQDVVNAHQVHYNRAVESVLKAVLVANNGALHATQLLDKDAQVRPPLSFSAAAVYDKLTPQSVDTFKAEIKALFGQVIGKGLLPYFDGSWHNMRLGLLPETFDGAVHGWAEQFCRKYFRTEIADNRRQRLAPGGKVLGDHTHVSGWGGDYMNTMLLSLFGRPYLLISKSDLAEKLGILGAAVSPIATYLPGTITDQGAVTAMGANVLVNGVNDHVLRASVPGVVGYGAATMSLQTAGSLMHVANPTELLGDQWMTGRELKGFGRFPEMVLAAAVASGSRRRVPTLEVTSLYGGGKVGPKPDNPLRLRPDTMRLNAADLHIFSLPDGRELVKPEQYRFPNLRGSLSEMAIWWARVSMYQQEVARRLRDEMGIGPARDDEDVEEDSLDVAPEVTNRDDAMGIQGGPRADALVGAHEIDSIPQVSSLVGIRDLKIPQGTENDPSDIRMAVGAGIPPQLSLAEQDPPLFSQGEGNIVHLHPQFVPDEPAAKPDIITNGPRLRRVSAEETRYRGELIEIGMELGFGREVQQYLNQQKILGDTLSNPTHVDNWLELRTGQSGLTAKMSQGELLLAAVISECKDERVASDFVAMMAHRFDIHQPGTRSTPFGTSGMGQTIKMPILYR